MDAIFAVTAVRPEASRPAGPRQRSPGPRRAFTLVEMLTVVVIIGILASLITGAVIQVRKAVRIHVIAVEINQLDAALKAYKLEHGEYPPDFTGVADPDPAVHIPAHQAVIRHLTRAYPRYNLGRRDTEPAWAELSRRMYQGYGLQINAMDPSAALVFWLGGLPDGRGSEELVGFSANPKDPFDIGDDLNGNLRIDPGETRGSRQAPFFEFKQDRLKFDDNGVCRYFPDTGGSGENAPYVYFRSRNGNYDGHPGFKPAEFPQNPHPEWGSTGPCLDTRRPRESNDPTASKFEWMNGDTCQIRAAGLDGKLGPGVSYPTGEDYAQDEATFDDQTNFSEGGTLEDQM